MKVPGFLNNRNSIHCALAVLAALACPAPAAATTGYVGLGVGQTTA